MRKSDSIKSGTTSSNKDVAIIGMGCIFPKSRNLKEYWRLLLNGIDAIEDIPEDTHWKLEDYFNQDPAARDHTYCKRGGFLPQITFDPLSYGIPPNNLEATDTSQLLGLEVARMALEDAGYPIGHPFLQENKVNVILGVTGTQELVIPLGARLGHPIWKKALEDSGIDKDKSNEIIERIQGDYVQWQENSFPGLLGNVVAGRIANRLNLSGTNSVCDAACASSLSAIHNSMMELVSGKCDMSITGGVDSLNDIFMHMCFSKTGVLSHTSDAKPFSKDADGTVLGEGIGMLVLKRLDDAEKNNDKIYAVIKGIGTSSDGKTSAIYAPDANGQLKALKEAYQDANVDPSTVGLIEAHGTGTRVGDKVEFDALKKCYKNCLNKNETAVGSVKSMIGHTKAAAGAAGIIKSALSLYNKVIPPTLKAKKPDPDLDINNSSFYLNAEAKPWINDSSIHPRRSGVSAFGFGGSNFHAVLEEYTPTKIKTAWDGSTQIVSFSADNKDLLLEKVNLFNGEIKKTSDEQRRKEMIDWLSYESRKSFSSKHNYRLLFVHKTNEDIHIVIDGVIQCIHENKTKKNIYYSQKKNTGKLGFLFPGQGSQYTGMGKDLVSVFPEAIETFENAELLFSKEKKESHTQSLHDFIYPPPLHLQTKTESENLLRQTQNAQPAIGIISLAMVKILNRFGIKPDVTCGHSFGELSALCSANWIDEKTFLELAVLRGKHMANASSKDGDSGSMLAVQTSLEKIEALIKDETLDLIIANKNSYSQSILSGSTDEILRAKKSCKKRNLKAVKLPVAAAFHSKRVEKAALPFKNEVNRKTFTPTNIDVLSNTTGELYSKDIDTIKALIGNQLANPVDFISNIEEMANQEVSTFIEIGPKSVLTNLSKSILENADISAVSIDNSGGKKSGIEDLAHTLCLIAANGFDIDLTHWEDPVQKPKSKKMAIPLSGANLKPSTPCTLPKSKPMQTNDDYYNSPQSGKSQKTDTIQNDHLANASNQKEIAKQRSAQQDINKRFKKPHTNNGNPIKKMNTERYEAMKMIQKGLEAMQQLQTQTAHAHEKFLETQAQASQTLANMMEQTHNFSSTSPERSKDLSVPPVQDDRTDKKEYSTTIFDNNKPLEAITDSKTSAPQSIKSEVKPVEVQAIKEKQHAQSNTQAEQILFKIVSNLTGFPVEMLEPEMDIESDLGIDSIKKVEIISELEKEIPSCEGLTSENIGSVRTLTDICQSIQTQTETSTKSNIDTTSSESNRNENTSASHSISKGSKRLVSSVLLDTISELTGFPVEMLEPSMNLESDLGIDSIKRVEILSKLEQELDHIESISSDDIGNLKTIEEIIQYILPAAPAVPDDIPNNTSTFSTDESTHSVESKKKTPPSDINPEKQIHSAVNTKHLIRQVVKLKEYPTNQIRFYNGARIELSEKKKVYITQDSSGISNQFKIEFEKLGINTVLIDVSQKKIPNLRDAGGIVLVADSFNPEDDRDTALNFLEFSFQLIKKNAQYLFESATDKDAFFTTVSFLGGTFGFDDKSFNGDPIYGGLAGLTKTAALEWPDVLCRTLDMPDNKKLCIENAEAAVALMMTHGSVEMGLDGDSCNIPILINEEIETHSYDIKTDDVIIITGGAKGVTATCAIELAKTYSPTIILIGRSKVPFTESAWSNGIDDPAQLKKAILSNHFVGQKPKPADLERQFKKILSNRQIHHTIHEIERYGSRVDYYSADIRNYNEISGVLTSVRDQYHHISGVIHGAGILEDKLIIDKQIDQFKKVIETKVIGLHHIMQGTEQDKLKFFILFSSIAARYGNAGQCDYSMANEILNKTAQKYAIENAECITLSINWGPWDGGMVDASLHKEFQKRGIDLIPLDAGAKQLIKEIGNINVHTPEVVIGAPLIKSKKYKNVKLSKVIQAQFGITAIPALSDHQINHEPVVPFALFMEYHAIAAEKNNPGLIFAGLDHMRLLKGLRPGNVDQSIEVKMGKCIPSNHGFKAQSNISSKAQDDTTFIHSSCDVILKEKRPNPPVLSKAAFMALEPYSKTVEHVYSDILFHGNEFQGIKAINGYSKNGIEIITKIAPNPESWIKSPINHRWKVDPLVLDAAFQAAILWSYERMGQVCLPSYLANFRLYSSFDNHKGDIRILFTVNEESKNKIKGYFTFLDENETVLASIMGFEAITDPSLNNKFKAKPLFDKQSILAFAQGNPSEAFGKKYKIFDKEREIARLPQPPYFFMDRVLNTEHTQWEMEPGGWIEAQYDIPEDGWYFKANHTKTMPFCILLEIALQPCGWLAAYAGSALQSNKRLHFRNLGGKAILFKSLSKYSGTITMKSRMKEVSKAGDMIIQDFEMEILKNGETYYKGITNFGFFTSQALLNQVGIRTSKFLEYQLPKDLQIDIKDYKFGSEAPITPEDSNVDKNTGMPSKALRMIDKIDVLSFNGGIHNKGYIKASKKVDPSEWFFKAHFYQDPVCPGSLGIESFLQMIRFYLLKKFNLNPKQYESILNTNKSHEWIYRGQIIPSNKIIEIQAHIKKIKTDNDDYSVTADGALVVDGICIYEMKDFEIGFMKHSLKKWGYTKSKLVKH